MLDLVKLAILKAFLDLLSQLNPVKYLLPL